MEEDHNKFRFGAMRDSVDDFIDEFEEVRQGARTGSASTDATTTASTTNTWGFVMMNEDERRELVHRLQAAVSSPSASTRPQWRLSSPSQPTRDASSAPQPAAEAAFEEEEERLAEQGADQTWTFTADELVRSSPFLDGPERETLPHYNPGLVYRPPALLTQQAGNVLCTNTTTTTAAKQQQKQKEEEEEEEEPWVTVDRPPAMGSLGLRASYAAATSAAEVDKYIEEEFELTNSSARELKNAESLRDEQAYAQLRALPSNAAKAKSTDQRWSSLVVPLDRNKCVHSLRNHIRRGVPDARRPPVWRTVVGCVEFERAYPNYYATVLERVFGQRLPTRFYQVPAFGGELRPGDHFLTSQGVAAAARLLWALTMENPDVDYVPAIPDLVCILLTFLSEADAYVVAHLMLEQSRSNRWYLCLSNRKLTLFLHTYRSLIAKCLPDVSSQMDVLGVEAEHFADMWFKRLFIGALPFLTVLRIFDCYLAEGSHVLYRVALAILQSCRRVLVRADTALEFVSIVEQAALQLEDADSLLRAAFSLSFQHRHTSAFDEANQPKVADVIEPPYRPLVMPNLTETSELMDDVQFQALWSLIPSRFTIRDPTLVFSTTKHGFSLKSLLDKCEDVRPAVLLIRDKQRRVFGAFSTEGLRLCRNENFYGNREDMLFTLVPEVKSWTWLAGHAKQFVRITPKGLYFGDARGLCVDEELWHGTSEKSKTFENEPLSGDTTQFQCVTIEVWGFK